MSEPMDSTGERNRSDDLLDQMLHASHSELLDAIHAAQVKGAEIHTDMTGDHVA